MLDKIKDWDFKNLSEISKIQSGGTPSRSKKEYWDGEIPWVKISDITNLYVDETTEKITELGLKNSSTNLFPKGTILFTIFATIGKIGILNIEATTNQAIAGITPNEDIISSKFLTYSLQDLALSLENQGKGVAQKNINLSILKATKIPLPPLQEQNRIVAKLDQLFAHLETAKKGLEKIPTLLKEFRQAVLTQAVTGKLTEEWREVNNQLNIEEYINNIIKDIEKDFEFRLKEAKVLGKQKPRKQNNKKSDKGDNNLPALPSNWFIKRAEDISYLITDGVHQKPNYTETGEKFLSVKNVRPFKVIDDGCKFISKSDHLKYIERCNPQKGDLLYTKVGATYGYAAQILEDYEFSIYVSLALIKPSKLINSSYLELLFNSPYIFDQARNRISGSGVPDLHLIEIRDFKIPIPSPEEQTEIVRRVEALFVKADSIEERYKSLKEKIDQLPQAILGKAFRGEL